MIAINSAVVKPHRIATGLAAFPPQGHVLNLSKTTGPPRVRTKDHSGSPRCIGASLSERAVLTDPAAVRILRQANSNRAKQTGRCFELLLLVPFPFV